MKGNQEVKLQALVENLIYKVDEKIRKSLARIDIPTPEGEKSNELLEKIEAINKKINFFIDQAERMGEEGKLDESETIMKEIDRLKLQKTEISSMNESVLLQREKQMRVCEICGAMQSLTDTEKRLTTHLEGKLHAGNIIQDMLFLEKLLLKLSREKKSRKRKWK